MSPNRTSYLSSKYTYQLPMIIRSPLDQFEIRDLLSLNAPVLGNFSLSMTNIALYLTSAGYLVFVLSVLSTNNGKIISNS